MKLALIWFVFSFLVLCAPSSVAAQSSSGQNQIDSTAVYQILKTDGTILRGRILESNELNLKCGNDGREANHCALAYSSTTHIST
jgi:hypothetical protein